MNNVYYSPETFDLKEIGEIEWRDADWEFDKSVVWKSLEGDTYYWASDSGCSCPTPFEDCGSVADLESGTIHQAIEAMVLRYKDEVEKEFADNNHLAQVFPQLMETLMREAIDG